MIYRVTDKDGYFIRDDFSFDEETEIGLVVEPAEGLFLPKWDGKKWVEGITQETINILRNNAQTEFSIEQRIKMLEDALVDVALELYKPQ